MDQTTSPLQRARSWLRTEQAIFDGQKTGPNEFDPYVPVEVRERSEAMRSIGLAPPFTDTHAQLWAALSEAMGIEKFYEPLGWSAMDVKTHLFGQ